MQWGIRRLLPQTITQPLRLKPLDAGLRGRRRVWGWRGRNLAVWTFVGEAELGEEPDAVVVEVELVPGEAVAGADGVGVVVVVPAFAAGEQGDPPGVARVVLGVEAARAEHVGGGVDQPGGVQAESDAQEGSPEEHGDGAVEGVAGGREGCAEDDLQRCRRR